MKKVALYWLRSLMTFFVAPHCLAQTYSMEFVDQNNQPIEFVVAMAPSVPIKPAIVDQAPAIMDQINMQFSPLVIAVEQGRKVSFPNSDNIRHHVYSFSKAKRFETKLYANKPDAPVEFDQAGLVVLGCNIHDSMIGYIFVAPTTVFSVSDKQGMANFVSDKAPAAVEYWHPWSEQPSQVQTLSVSDWPKGQTLKIQLTVNPPQVKSNDSKKRFGNRW